jgi:hypothetical protein
MKYAYCVHLCIFFFVMFYYIIKKQNGVNFIAECHGDKTLL